MSLRAAVAACIRWGDLLNNAPFTLELTNEGLSVSLPKRKRGGSLAVDLGGIAIFLTPRQSPHGRNLDTIFPHTALEVQIEISG